MLSVKDLVGEVLVTWVEPPRSKESFCAAAMNRKGLLKYVQSLLHAVIQDSHHERVSALN